MSPHGFSLCKESLALWVPTSTAPDRKIMLHSFGGGAWRHEVLTSSDVGSYLLRTRDVGGADVVAVGVPPASREKSMRKRDRPRMVKTRERNCSTFRMHFHKFSITVKPVYLLRCYLNAATQFCSHSRASRNMIVSSSLERILDAYINALNSLVREVTFIRFFIFIFEFISSFWYATSIYLETWRTRENERCKNQRCEDFWISKLFIKKVRLTAIRIFT